MPASVFVLSSELHALAGWSLGVILVFPLCLFNLYNANSFSFRRTHGKSVSGLWRVYAYLQHKRLHIICVFVHIANFESDGAVRWSSGVHGFV